jgi:hypothetical protein
MLNSTQRRIIRISALAVACAWILLGAAILFVVWFVIWCLSAGAAKYMIPRRFTMVMLAWLGAFVLSGITYFFLQVLVKCPGCGLLLLKNPLVKENRKIRYSVPWALECNRVSFQVVRALREQKIRCVQCRRDFDLF